MIIGVDPGGVSGVALLPQDGEPLAYQCCAAATYGLVVMLAEASDSPEHVVFAGEKFVPGTGAGARRKPAGTTRGVIGDLNDLGGWHWRSAAEVKPWATDKRIERAGLAALTAALPHARDAFRHALFCAVHDLGWPDPLSRRPR